MSLTSQDPSFFRVTLISLALSAVVLVLFVLFYPRIFAVTFDEAFARATGVKAGSYNMLIALLTALTVVVGMRMMNEYIIYYTTAVLNPKHHARTEPMAEKSMNTNRFTATMPAPVGSEYTQDSSIPTAKHTTDTTAEQTVTALKWENSRIDESAGKMIRLEISSVPIMRMPTTTVRAVSNAISML